ncbi:MAG: V-type ATP synthase subunit D [Candidatus Freyarchaeota archaeon]|nr:V-type ATP synthase subunit D [Candidatus Jordarchaeia archaeon]
MSTSIIEGIHPTRMELLALKRRIILAEKGHDLLKEKRDALVMHFFDILEDVGRLRKEMNNALREAFEALIVAKMVMGPLRVEEAAMGVEPLYEVETSIQNIMGVKVPLLNIKERKVSMPPYGLTDTSVVLDEAARKFREALRLAIQLAEVETAVRRLAEEIDKTKRRVNALKYIIIPKLENTIRYISLHLEEREREDLFRLKRVKAILERKETAVVEETAA